MDFEISYVFWMSLFFQWQNYKKKIRLTIVEKIVLDSVKENFFKKLFARLCRSSARRCWACLPPLIWIGAVILSLLLKLPPSELKPWFVLWSFFLLRLLYLSKSIIQPSVEYWSYVWTGAPRCYVEMLDEHKKTDVLDCWLFTCCSSGTLGSSSKFRQLKLILYVLLW